MTRPLIAITGNFSEASQECLLAKAYYRAVAAAGGVPVIVPPVMDEEAIEALAGRIDGLLLSGGADLNPLLVGEEPTTGLHGINAERDAAEWLLTERALERQVPVLGICRGMQLLAQVMGGHVCQDMPEPKIRHSQDAARWVPTHTVTVAEGSLLRRIVGADTIAVNSFHHQAVDDAGSQLRAVAWAKDGTIEAVESAERRSILGVQWHPEAMTAVGVEQAVSACYKCRRPYRPALPPDVVSRSAAPADTADDTYSRPVRPALRPSAALFAWLVGEAESYARARRIHSHIITLDSHCDTPMKFDGQQSIADRTPWCVDLPKMRAGGLDASIMVAYLPQGPRDDDALRAAMRQADETLSALEAQVAACPDEVGLARTRADILRLKREGRRAILLGVENGYTIGRDITQIERLRRRGVVYMTLCHNGDNDLCDSARRSQQTWGGLSPLGREAIKEMNRVGMLVDMSHASEQSFWGALELSSRPIVCSHSSCRALCDHPRNLTDSQMRALAQAGGVMQLTFYEGFLRTDGRATLADCVAHINHARSVMGIEHIGIGTDFDGDGGVPGLADASYLINLTRALISEGYTEDDLERLWGGNFLALMPDQENIF